MNSRIILLGLAVAAFTSCSTAYKTGQTPDDVYYSPARETESYVKVENDDDRRYRGEERYQNSRYQNDEYVNSDDRWLRMRVRNRYRWSAFDDYYAWNDWRYNTWNYSPYYSYSPFNSYSRFNNYWSSYYSWNNYYNPYCRSIVVSPKINTVAYNRVRNFNLNSYGNNTYSNSNMSPSRNSKINRGSSGSGYNNNNSTLGNSVRRVFSNSNNNNSRDTYYSPSSSDRPTRVYQPSSSSSSSPSSRSSGSSSSGSSGSSGSSSGSRPSRGN